MIALVYDITSQESFIACQKWMDIAKRLYPDISTPLTGNVQGN